jgi:hypothetical protein
MFAKVYTQIFDSSIAENHTVRHVFMDLLVLADSDGVVDMTQAAISRRTNVPLDVLEPAMQVLSEPDPDSRSEAEEGRRIALVDPHRDWGWRIINYEHYRKLRDEEGRRSYHREYMKNYRRSVKNGEGGVNTCDSQLSSVKKCEGSLSLVKAGDAPLTHAEAEAEAEGDAEESTSSKLRASRKAKPATAEEIIGALKENPAYKGINIDREFRKMLVWCETNGKQASQKRFINWLNRVETPMATTAKSGARTPYVPNL